MYNQDLGNIYMFLDNILNLYTYIMHLFITQHLHNNLHKLLKINVSKSTYKATAILQGGSYTGVLFFTLKSFQTWQLVSLVPPCILFNHILIRSFHFYGKQLHHFLGTMSTHFSMRAMDQFICEHDIRPQRLDYIIQLRKCFSASDDIRVRVPHQSGQSF